MSNYQKDWWITKALEGSGHSLIKILPRNLLTGTKEAVHQSTQYSCWYSKRVLPQYKSRVLPLGHSAQCFFDYNIWSSF
jgi:hypothetical protein